MHPYIAVLAVIVAAAGAHPAQAQEHQGQNFVGFDCTVDCSSHAAGYAWAEDKGIANETDCPKSNSRAFRQGCLTYARGGILDDTSNTVADGMPVSPLDFDEDDDPTKN